jgi:hypothetical protein
VSEEEAGPAAGQRRRPEAVLAEEHGDLVGAVRPVLQPGVHDGPQARVVLPLERDAHRGPDRAVEAVATDEPPGCDLLLAAVRTAERRDDGAVPVPEREQFPRAPDRDAGRLYMPQDDALRVALREAQLGWEGAIDAFDAESGDGSPVVEEGDFPHDQPRRKELLGQAEGVEQFERAGVHLGRPGDRRRPRRPVDDPAGDAVARQS